MPVHDGSRSASLERIDEHRILRRSLRSSAPSAHATQIPPVRLPARHRQEPGGLVPAEHLPAAPARHHDALRAERQLQRRARAGARRRLPPRLRQPVQRAEVRAGTRLHPGGAPGRRVRRDAAGGAPRRGPAGDAAAAGRLGHRQADRALPRPDAAARPEGADRRLHVPDGRQPPEGGAGRAGRPRRRRLRLQRDLARPERSAPRHAGGAGRDRAPDGLARLLRRPRAGRPPRRRARGAVRHARRPGRRGHPRRPAFPRFEPMDASALAQLAGLVA